MSTSSPGRKALWLLPIVIAICAVMVLPGGTFVASSAHAGNPMASAVGVRPAATTAVSAPSLPSYVSTTPLTPSSLGPSALSSNAPSSSASRLTPSVSTSNARSALAANLPSYLDNVPWLQAALHPGSSSVRTPISLPNLYPLEHPPTAVNGVYYPADVAQPVPIGVADYGLGVTPYSYNSSFMMGQVTLNAPPNVTQPDGAFVINPTAVGERLGYVGSEYEFGLQLNTIGINLTIPGTSDQGYVWAQWVVNWNDSGIHFIQDTWNFSLDSGAYWNQNSIYSGCGGDESWANYILQVYGGVLQCSEGNIPISAADYPVTISLYNNFTTNAQYRSQLVYGYSVTEAGSGQTTSGVADTVVFNNPDTSVAPANTPANTINPFEITPTFGVGSGYWEDSEMDVVGGIEGDNAAFSAINGSVNLEYSNSTSTAFQNVPSAYNFGTDTGETAMGIASYWTAGHTMMIHQGPTMLYGLWNAEPQASVAVGNIHVAGTIHPSYGFVFMSNTAPVLDPWNGVERDNMSWLPTTSTGAFNTYLPPLGAPWTTTYYVQAFAAGSAEYNGTVTGSTTSLSITLAAASGVIRAPLYMSSAAQASALAQALGGAAGPPYVFQNLVVNANFTFNHLNDWDFPSFEVFQAQGVNSVVVSNVVQGNDSYFSGNSYIIDYAAGYAGLALLVPAPTVFTDLGPYTQGIDIYFGTNDHVLNQDLFTIQGGIGEPGGSQITLWSDTDALVGGTVSLFESFGIFVGNSLDTTVEDTLIADSIGVNDMGSTGTMVTSLDAFSALAVETTAAVDPTYSWLNVSEGGEGIEAGSDYGLGPMFAFWGAVGLTVDNLNVTYESLGANLTFSSDTTINNLTVYDPEYGYSQGFQLDGTTTTVVNGLVANYGSAMYVWNSTGLTVNGLVLENMTEYYLNSQVKNSMDTTLNSPVVDDTYLYDYGAGIGVVGMDDTGFTVTNGLVIDMFGGIVAEYSSGFVGTNLVSQGSEFSYELDFCTASISVSGVTATNDYMGLNLYESNPAAVTNVAADATGVGAYYGGGVALYDDVGNSVSTVTSTYGSFGVKIDSGGSGNTVSGVTADSSGSEYLTIGVGILAADGNTVTNVDSLNGATGVLVENGLTGNTISDVSADGALGVEFIDTVGGTASGVTATDDGVGVVVDPSSLQSISDVTASGHSEGVIIEDSTQVSVATVSVTDFSMGVLLVGANDVTVTGVTLNDTSIGVLAVDSQFVTISGVTAKGTAPVLSPFDYASVWGEPIAAVDTLGTTGVTVTGVTTTTYSAALYDDGSGALTVTALNATGGFYAVVLNDTYSSLFSGIGAYQDYQGMLIEDDASDNTITASSFVDDSSYGVAITYGYDNTIWDNNFIGDNGATNTYSASHIQAVSADYNYFNTCSDSYCTTGIGNYWADWHTYGSNGHLAPYWVSGASYDMFPIGPEETFIVSFTETGLATGTSWSVTLSGVTETSMNPTINFTVPMGTYLYQVNNVPGYTVSPSGGTLTEAGAQYNVPVTFSAVLYAVTLSESGLGTGTSWGATVNGQTQSTTGTSLTFYLPAGGYAFSFNAVSGYNLPATGASGKVNVTNAPVDLATTYTPTSTPSYVQTSDFNNWLGIAIALAVIALVIGLLALFLRRRKEPPAQGAQAWSPPPSGGSPPASGGSPGWSEGPPSGGSPPS